MHLIYIHQYFAFPDIHSSTRSYDLAKEFVKQGITVTVITTTTKVKGVDEKKRWNYIQKDGIHFWVLTSTYSQKLPFYKRLFLFFHFMLFASIKVMQIKCDLVLTTSTPLTIAFPALIKKAVTGTSFVFEVRDVWPEIPIKLGYIRNKLVISFLNWFERLIYKKAAHIVPLSSGMEKSIKERCNISHTTVITNISEITRFQSKADPIQLGFDFNRKNLKILLYAGAMGRINDIKYVTELAGETFLVDPDILFLIIGVGNEKESLINHCRETGILNKNIFFYKPVPKKQLPYLYSICTLGSSFCADNKVLWNNSANKFFDTLAAGKPILINYEGWQADLIKKENIGYILPPRLSENSVKEFVDYINNKSLLQLQGKNALELAKREFSLEKAIQLYLEVFDKVMNTKK